MTREDLNFQGEKFKVFVRYLIKVAKDKRCVTYSELENVFGLSHGQAGHYAGMLGDYCWARKIPPLNGLIIGATDCIPSHGFDWYQKQYGQSWGEIVSQCWKKFHVTSSEPKKRTKDFGGRDKDIEEFLAKHEPPPSYAS